MEKFLIGYKPPSPRKRKTHEDRLVHQRKYDQETRDRFSFLPKWTAEFTWVKQGGFMKVCLALNGADVVYLQLSTRGSS